MSESFLTLQYNIDMSIVNLLNNRNVSYDEKIGLKMEKFPYPPYKVDAFIAVIQKLLPLLVMLGFLLWSMLIVRDIVHEKELRLRVWLVQA